MPVAIRNTDTEKFDLKTLPGAFVVLRKLDYGQILERRAMMKMSVSASGKSKSFEGEMAMANRAIQLFEFRNCIVEHNLERVEGQLLNMGNERDMSSLDPKVGQEVEKFIEDMNNFDPEEDEEAVKNSSGE